MTGALSMAGIIELPAGKICWVGISGSRLSRGEVEHQRRKQKPVNAKEGAGGFRDAADTHERQDSDGLDKEQFMSAGIPGQILYPSEGQEPGQYESGHQGYRTRRSGLHQAVHYRVMHMGIQF